MRILVADPLGSKGHINFIKFYLRALAEIGHVTFATFPSYHAHFQVGARIEIPERFNRQHTKLEVYWNQIRVLDFILRRIQFETHDKIVFLSYETISFYLRWPKDQKVYLFDHNNIPNVFGSRIKTYCYKQLSPPAIHFAFMEYIAQYIEKESCGRSIVIPHPYYRCITADDTKKQNWNATKEYATGKKIIFSPSGRTPSEVTKSLKEFVQNHDGYYLVAKGQQPEESYNYCTRPFFENYEELMENCDLVFIGGLFRYRVSGVAYEALSYGKATVIMDSPFAKVLQTEYPHMVFTIDKIKDILSVDTVPEQIRKEHARFLCEHGFDTNRSDIVRAFSV